MEEQVVAALAVLQDPAAAQAQRTQAHEFVEQIKNDDASCFQFANALTAPDRPENVRHFGLHLFENLVTRRWNSLNVEQHTALKEHVLSTLAQGTRHMLVEPRFVKEKAALLVVHVAKREWPVAWPDLFQRLFAVSQAGDTQMELVVFALRCLWEEVVAGQSCSTSDMSDRRRNELLQALHAEAPGLLSFFYNAIIAAYKTVTEARQGGAQDRVRECTLLVRALLQGGVVFCGLAAHKPIHESNWMTAVCALVNDAEFQPQALDCLLAIATRKPAKDAPLELSRQVFTTMLELGRVVAASGQYELQKRVCLVLSRLGVNHVELWISDESSRNAYLETIAQWTSHPSITISQLTLPFWKLWLERRDINIPVTTPELFAKLFHIFADHCLKAGDPAKNNSPVCEYSRLEFTSTAEFDKQWALYKNMLVNSLRFCTSQHPETAMAFAADRLRGWAMTHASPPTTPPDLNEDPDVGPCAQLNAIVIILECVLEGVPEHLYSFASDHTGDWEAQRVAVSTSCETVVNGLMSLDLPHPLHMDGVLRALGHFTGFYTGRPQILPFIVQKCLGLFTEPVTAATLSHYEQVKRYRACRVLLRLATRVPGKWSGAVNDLATTVHSLAAQGKTQGHEQYLLFEFLSTMGNDIEPVSSQIAFYSALIQPIREQWTSADLTASLTPDALVGCIYTNPTVSTEGFQAQAPQRERVRYHVMILLSLFRRIRLSGTKTFPEVIAFATEQLQAVLPNMLQLTTMIHSFWSPEVRGRVQPAWNQVFEGGDLDAGLQMEQGGSHLPPPEAKDDPVFNLCHWLRSLRDSVYQFFAFICSKQAFFAAVESNPSLVMGAIFSHWTSMENRHVRQLLRTVVESIIINCPPRLYEEVLRPTMPPMFTSLYSRLVESYAAKSARDGGMDPNGAGGGGGSEVTEILQDTALMQMHRQTVDLILAMFNPVDGPGVRGGPSNETSPNKGGPPPQPPSSPILGVSANEMTEGGGVAAGAVEGSLVTLAVPEALGVFMLSDEVLGGAIIGILSQSLTWPSPKAATVAIAAGHRIIPRIVADARYHEMVGAGMMCQCFRSVAVQAKREVGMIQPLLRDILCHLGPICAHPYTVLGALPGMTTELMAEVQHTFANQDSIGPKKQQVLVRRAMDLANSANGGNGGDSNSLILDLPGSDIAEHARKQKAAANKKGAAADSPADGLFAQLFQ